MSKTLKIVICLAGILLGLYLIGIGFAVPLAIPLFNTIAFVGGIALCGGAFTYALITLFSNNS